MANYGNANSRVMGSLAIKSSLVKIDLAALGITSLNIVVNIPDQNNMDGPSFGSKLMLHEPLVAQPEPYLLVPPAIAMNKPAQITKVYYRRRFKNKGGSYEKQAVLVDHFSEGVPSAESSRSMRGLGKGVTGKPYPRLCNARRPRLKPGTFRSQAVRLYRFLREYWKYLWK